MKNISKYTLLILLLIVSYVGAQTPITIVKENNYTVTGTETLIASEKITLKPNTKIKSGSTFTAKIQADAYRNNLFSNENYVFTRTYQTPLNDALEISKNNDVIETIIYFDGLGRPMQNISIKASPSIQDIVTAVTYDSIGRLKKEFLPYMDTSTSLASYRNNAIVNTNNYYITNYPADINSAKPNPFSEKDFEKSPLNRVIKQGMPGADWALKNGHEIKFDYQTNEENEVKEFSLNFKYNNDGLIQWRILGSNYYAKGKLYKKVIKDENWIPSDGNNKTTQEFTNKKGQLVLKRVFGTSNVNGFLTNVNHDTYYLYDDKNNLIYVIPPLAENKLIKTNLSTGGFDEFNKTIFHETFSGTSGSGSVNIKIENNVLQVACYAGFEKTFLSEVPQDLATTPCLLPDIDLGTTSNGDYKVSITGGKLKFTNITGNPSTGFFTLFTVNLPSNCTGNHAEVDENILKDLCYQYKYDLENKLIEKKLPGKDWEYIIYDKVNRPILTQDANLKANNKWLFTKYDAFNRPAYTGEYNNSKETTRASVQSLADNSSTVFENKQLSTLNINGTSLNYSNNAFPNSGIDLYTINYYDDYNNIDLDGGTAVSSYNITPISNAKGLLTCSKIRILETNNWITNLNYFNNKGQLIYNYNKNNYLDVITTTSAKLDFAGKMLETTSTHKKGTNDLITITDYYSYDHAGRLLTQSQSINNQTKEIIVSNKYDNLGNLISKGIGGKINQSRLQNVDYSYNIRGWLKNINNIDALGNDLFAFKLNYNDAASGTSLYNGNISQTFWKTANTDNSLKSYNYSYDDLNRLTQATDKSALNPGRYNEGISYDKNGNIMSLLRFGHITPSATAFGLMDNLNYTYTGNRLDKVEDLSGNTEGFNNRSNIAVEYSYDQNGNMKTDANKNITAITYNHLNLPTAININNGTVQYKYDATGVKQSKIITTGESTYYAGSFIYENNTLKQFSQPEGYVTYNSGIYNYIYQYKDHLGNIRLSYQDKDDNGVVNSSEIVQENNYYPFGLTHQGYNAAINGVDNKYKYNGKELQDNNIGGIQLNLYDYGARNYDPAIGRWMNIDPLAEQMRRWSPYNYTFDNPMRFTDPDGMGPDDWIKKGNRVFYDATVKTQKDATTIYGDNAKIMSEGSQTLSTSNGQADGRYSYTYHDNGTVTDKNNETIDFNNEDVHTEGGTTIVNPENKSGNFSGFSLGGAAGGGISLEVGVVNDPSGGSALYFTYGGNVGLGGGAGSKAGVITPTGDNPFAVSDFFGKGNSWSASLDTPLGGAGVERGGSQGKDGFLDYGNNPRGYKYTAVPSTLGHYPSLKAGAVISETRTWTLRLN